MSKLIVEMAMPKRCIECGVRLKCKRYVCGLQQDIAEDLNPLMGDKDCLIKGALPDEHGDLVDADTVLWEVPDSEGIVPPMPVTIGDLIEGYDVPIVIAAERKDDGTTAD